MGPGVVRCRVHGIRAPPKVDYLFRRRPARTTVNVTASGTFERWPVKAWCENPRVSIKPGKSSGQLAITLIPTRTPASHGFAFTMSRARAPCGRFCQSLAGGAREEPNDDPKKPHVLETSSVIVNGRLDKQNEVDTFAVKLTLGQCWSHRSKPTARCVRRWTACCRFCQRSFVLEQNDDYHGLDPQIAFTAPKDGVYLVRCSPFRTRRIRRFDSRARGKLRISLDANDGAICQYIPLAVSRSIKQKLQLIGWNIPKELRTHTVKPAESVRRLTTVASSDRGAVLHARRIGQRVVKATATERSRKDRAPVTITGSLSNAGTLTFISSTRRRARKCRFAWRAARRLRSIRCCASPTLRQDDPAIASQAIGGGSDARLCADG